MRYHVVLGIMFIGWTCLASSSSAQDKVGDWQYAKQDVADIRHFILEAKQNTDRISELRKARGTLAGRIESAKQLVATQQDPVVKQKNQKLIKDAEEELSKMDSSLAKLEALATKFADNAEKMSLKVDRRIDELEKLRERSRAALKRVTESIPATQQAFEDWIKLDESARNELAWTAVKTILDVALVSKGAQIRKGAEIPDEKFKRLGAFLFDGDKALLHSLRQNNPTLFRAINKEYLEATKEFMKVNNAIELIEKLERFNATIAAAEHLTRTDALNDLNIATTRWEILSEVLKLYVPDPRLNIFLSEVELVAAVGYAKGANYVAGTEVNRLLNLGEDQLTEVANYSRALVRETNSLNALREQRNQLNAFRNAPAKKGSP